MTAPVFGTGLRQPVFARGHGSFSIAQTVADDGIHVVITLLNNEDGSKPQRWFPLACAQCGSELEMQPGITRGEICEHLDVTINDESGQ